MKFGIGYANILKFTSREGLTQLACGAEAAGFESLWTVEHVIYPDGYQSEYPYSRDGKMPMSADLAMPDPLIWMTWAAALTERINFCTGVLILPQRNPVILAKELASISALADGRLRLGIGVGWLEEEFDALGVPFARRGDRADEYIGAMRALWSGDHAAFDGEFVSFSGASINPKPSGGSVPVHIGGHSAASARRAGRLGDGYFPASGNLEELYDIARQSAADAGRDPNAIEFTSAGEGLLSDDPSEAIERAKSLGVTRMLVPSYAFFDRPVEQMNEFAARVITPNT